jgi:hypothetical protein
MSLDVVREHIKNIFMFVPDSIVVLHVTADQSNDFYMGAKALELEFCERVFVNDKRYSTFDPVHNVVGLATVHVSNYEYVKKLINFDVFSIHASNEMFIRKGVDNVYNNHSIGMTSYEPVDSYYDGKIIFNDRFTAGENRDFLANAINKIIPIKKVYWGGVAEGYFFDKNIMDEISRVVLALNHRVSCEPMVFSTIALNLFPEVIPRGAGRVTFTTSSQIVNDTEINNTLYGINGFESFFALKQVPRDINHPVRIKINNIIRDKYGSS